MTDCQETKPSPKKVASLRLPPFDDDDGDDGDSSHKAKRARKVKEALIDHTYRDYSRVEVTATDEDYEDEEGEDQRHDQRRKEPPRASSNFPAKLHAILSNPSYQHIIRWMPHGRSWNIIDKYLLTTVILPKHFAHSKFESFNRSVNGWGFKRLLREGPDKRTYYHECFLRGRPELTRLMQRLCNEGKRLPDKSGEPNLYEISKKYPLPELFPPLCDTASKPQSDNAYAMSWPHSSQPGSHQAVFPPPYAHGSLNMYGYPHSAPYPQMPSSAANMNNVPNLPGQVASLQYQPNPYGFYPYPHMMMSPQVMGAGHGYFVPYQQPQFFSPPESANKATLNGSAEKRGMTTPLAEGVKPGTQEEKKEEKPATTSNEEINTPPDKVTPADDNEGEGKTSDDTVCV